MKKKVLMFIFGKRCLLGGGGGGGGGIILYVCVCVHFFDKVCQS